MHRALLDRRMQACNEVGLHAMAHPWAPLAAASRAAHAGHMKGKAASSSWKEGQGQYLWRLHLPEPSSLQGCDHAPRHVHLLYGGLHCHAQHGRSHLTAHPKEQPSACRAGLHPGQMRPLSHSAQCLDG